MKIPKFTNHSKGFIQKVLLLECNKVIQRVLPLECDEVIQKVLLLECNVYTQPNRDNHFPKHF